MYAHGQFINAKGEVITVEILTHKDRTNTIEIGGDDILFAGGGVTTSPTISNSFDVLLAQEATIYLDTRRFIPDFFCANAIDAAVNVRNGDRLIFAGFVKPQTYSQDYVDAYDSLTLNCVDCIGALELYNYKHAGAAGVNYDDVKASAGLRSFQSYIVEALSELAAAADIRGDGHRILFDGSKRPTENSGKYSLLEESSVNDLIFLGDDETSVSPMSDVLTQLLQYFDLHLDQRGLDFRIFDWDTLRRSTTVAWHDLETGEQVAESLKTVHVTANNAGYDVPSLTIDEVFNQISVKCDVKGVDAVVYSPLDEDTLKDPFVNRQLYMREFVVKSTGDYARISIMRILSGNTASDRENIVTTWLLRVKDSANWKFYGKGEDLVKRFCVEGKNQQNYPNYLNRFIHAGLFSLGKAERKSEDAEKDNSLQNKVDMSNCLVISVNGNGKDADFESIPDPGTILASCPVAEYVGPTGSASFTPNDNETTNYIVFSGRIVLNPLTPVSFSMARYYGLNNDPETTTDDWLDFGSSFKGVDCGDFTGYRALQWYKAESPRDEAEVDEDNTDGFIPFNADTAAKQYKFTYSGSKDKTDKISKVSVIACMLVIGDKVLVEVGETGTVDDYEWHAYRTLEECDGDFDEYYQQSFTLGIDPKLGDYLIGTEFDIQNNVEYTMGIDAKGTAIPIRRSDNVNGRVDFKILGPVNTYWDVYTKRHKTWFRREKWSNESVPLLAHTASIQMKKFEVKIYSDNAQFDNSSDKDLIYVSDTDETYLNKQDSASFRVHSALTSEEAHTLGVSGAISLGTAVDKDGNGIVTIHDDMLQEDAKPEQFYVDHYYGEFHNPRLIIEQSVMDDGVNVGDTMTHQTLEGAYIIQGVARNTIEGTATITAKRI